MVDMGVNEATPVDYPDVGAARPRRWAPASMPAAFSSAVRKQGMAIVANKVPGVRAVSVYDPYTASGRAVASNNAQIITMGSQITGPAVAKKLIDIWLESRVPGRTLGSKVAKIGTLDEKYHSR
ncbi:MAG: RpiB/LacA/LacB family sugar-phosphate isomerase [Caldilineaceae bacterium]